MSKKTTGILAIGASAVLALAACTATPAEPTEPQDLRITIWSNSETVLAAYDDQIEAFKALHPDEVGEITIESLPFADYIPTITTQIAGGNAPDAGWMTDKAVGDFVSAQAIVDLAPVLKADPEYGYDDLTPSLMGQWEDGDATYGYPFSNAPTIAYYNVDLFAAAGIPTPTEMLEAGDWTWENARDAFAAISALDPNTYGMVIDQWQTFAAWQALRYVWVGWDADPWTAGGAECTWDSKEMVDALSYYHDLVFKDQSSPGPGTTADFPAGQVGVLLAVPSFAGNLKEVPFNWDVVSIPSGPAGDRNTFSSAGWVVFEQGESTSLAQEFVKFATSEDSSGQLAGVFTPPRASLLTPAVMSENSGGVLSPEQEEFVIDALQNGTALPQLPSKYEEAFAASKTALDALWTADADPKTVLNTVCPAIQSMLP